jgi:hypothetical protein
MNDITGGFVAMMARVWHRFALPESEAEPLAGMLAPMDDAGETVAKELQFDMEPSGFDRALEELAAPVDET